MSHDGRTRGPPLRREYWSCYPFSGSNMRLRDCHNFHDFRRLAKRRLPGPIFNYIDGAADDEVTYRQNTASFERCDLVPNILRGVESVDMSVTVMGQKLSLPIY